MRDGTDATNTTVLLSSPDVPTPIPAARTCSGSELPPPALTHAREADPASREPRIMQGGGFSPRGHFLLLSGKGVDDERQGGIRVFDRNGTLLCRSSHRAMPFLYGYHSGLLEGSEEPEGLTFWDVDALAAGQRPPSTEGQLHAILAEQRRPQQGQLLPQALRRRGRHVVTASRSRRGAARSAFDAGWAPQGAMRGSMVPLMAWP